MKILFVGAQKFEIDIFKKEFQYFPKFQIDFCNEKINDKTAILATNYDALISFVNDNLNNVVLENLKSMGLKAIFLRCAGYNHVNIKVAHELGMPVYRVPAYSPEAVAEHSIALLMTLNRKIHKAYSRVREMNFSLEGLVGYNLCNKKVGIIGTGKIGRAFAKIISGFGSEVVLFDVNRDERFAKSINAKYVEINELLAESDIISFHCPLNEKTKHLINQENIYKLKKGVILVNTSRGAIIESKALVNGLKRQHIGGAALDVYEFESELFFADHSTDIIQDDLIARLMGFPNVIITSHQGFLTTEALQEIARVTRENIEDYLKFNNNSVSLNLV